MQQLETRKESWHLDRADWEIQLRDLHRWKKIKEGNSLSLTWQRGDVEDVTRAVTRPKQLADEVIPTISFWVEMSKEERLCQSQLTNRCCSYQEQFGWSHRFRYAIDKAKHLILHKEKQHIEQPGKKDLVWGLNCRWWHFGKPTDTICFLIEEVNKVLWGAISPGRRKGKFVV